MPLIRLHVLEDFSGGMAVNHQGGPQNQYYAFYWEPGDKG